MAWGKRVAIVTVMVMIGSAAMAEPAGTPSFVPVTLEKGPSPGTVVVEPGDHLWKIAEGQLHAMLDRPVRPGEVVPYWLAVIETNRSGLKSGDPDLIYPGEVVTLPPTG
ncbi:MAG: hypothetical protein ABW021_08010 [Acidimicrobiia bacterium]|jgi:nucleoid-associated protein YgaU